MQAAGNWPKGQGMSKVSVLVPATESPENDVISSEFRIFEGN
jgi:hypothetical protein